MGSLSVVDHLKKMAPKPIRVIARMKEEEDDDDHELLSPVSRLFHEPDYNIYIMVIIGVKTQVDLKVIKANLGETLLKHSRFSSLQVMEEDGSGKMKWVPTTVNLDNHVIVPPVDPDIESPEKFIEDYMSELSKTSIPSTKPLWELHILKVKTSDAAAVGVFRIHHSHGDGISLVSLLLACTRKASDPDALPTIPTQKAPSPGKRVGFWQYLIRFWLFIRVLGNSFVDVMMFLATVVFLRDTETPLRSPNRSIPTQWRFARRIVSLDDVKMVKREMKCTINDVILGVTQAGLSKYLNKRYSESKREEKTNNLPNNIRLRATIFMNMRPSPGIHAFAEMMEKDTKAKWGNCFGLVLLPFSIGLYKDPLDYVRRAKATIDRKKQSLEAWFSLFIANLVLTLFGFKAASALSSRVPYQTTMMYSNIVGPLEEITFFGHPITFLAPTCYGQSAGLLIHVASYANKLIFVLSADEETIPDPHTLCDDLVHSLSLIKDATLSRESKAKDD